MLGLSSPFRRHTVFFSLLLQRRAFLFLRLSLRFYEAGLSGVFFSRLLELGTHTPARFFPSPSFFSPLKVGCTFAIGLIFILVSFWSFLTKSCRAPDVFLHKVACPVVGFLCYRNLFSFTVSCQPFSDSPAYFREQVTSLLLQSLPCNLFSSLSGTLYFAPLWLPFLERLSPGTRVDRRLALGPCTWIPLSQI